MHSRPQVSSSKKDVKFERIDSGTPFCTPSWAPSWSQVATKIHFEVGLNFDPASERLLEHLGLDFGGVLGVKLESKRQLKIRSAKT